MADNEDAVAAAIETAFGNAPAQAPAPKAAPAQPQAAAEPAAVQEDERTPLEQLADGIDPAAAPVAEPEPEEAEPEFVIEVNGEQELVKGKDQIKELLQKGRDYSRRSEEVARVREQLVAQAQLQQQAGKFQQAAMGDIAQLQSLDAQLEQFNKVDMASLIDSDFVSAMKLQQQRQALKEARDAKRAELAQKVEQFKQGQAQAAQQLLAAEEASLLAKLPAWRNSEVATAEKQAIARNLAESYGFNQSEIQNLMDHRFVLAARDAMKWRELQRNKGDKVKQVREAPPVVKPGAAPAQADANSKAGFDKFTREFRKQGRAGNHRAQEAALEKVLSRTFK